MRRAWRRPSLPLLLWCLAWALLGCVAVLGLGCDPASAQTAQATAPGTDWGTLAGQALIAVTGLATAITGALYTARSAGATAGAAAGAAVVPPTVQTEQERTAAELGKLGERTRRTQFETDQLRRRLHAYNGIQLVLIHSCPGLTQAQREQMDDSLKQLELELKRAEEDDARSSDEGRTR